MQESTGNNTSNIVRLQYREKVPVAAMKELIRVCLAEKLTSATYEADKCGDTAKQLSDNIKAKLKALGFERYKYIVQVLIGERRDQGVRMGTRCFWDSATDNQASDTFINDYIFCTATAFAVYLY